MRKISVIVLGILLVLNTFAVQAYGRVLDDTIRQKFIGWTEWIYDVRFNNHEKQALLQTLEKDWHSSDPEDVEGVQLFLQLVDEKDSTPAELLPVLRAKYYTAFMNFMGQNPENDPDMDVIRGAYDRQHGFLVPGNMPLTRELADNYARFVSFIHREASHGRVVYNNRDLVNQLMANFPALNTEEQMQLSEMVMNGWAQIDYGWKRASDAEKDEARRQWIQILESQEAAETPSARAISRP
ncbi:MAG: hypothetical protein M3O22_00490 [Pseudomonadota bacterium]|nr:hypothetical protein [Pseudomonadota bacterium]